MKFSLVRIDDRLIHGQVALGWSRAKGISCILAVDDDTAKNSFQCSLLKMATPPGVKSYIVTVDKAVEMIEKETVKGKIMLLVKSIKTLYELYQAGVKMDEVNVGNLRAKDADIKLLEYAYLTEQDVKIWKKMREYPIRFYGQSFPDQTKTELNQLIDNL